MPIQVTCPKCLTRFSVSEKFAGKKGPCPKCKSQIEVPEADDAVVIHAPADGAPKDSKGQSVLKPIKRKETRLSRRQGLLLVGAVVLAIGVALGLRAVDGSGKTAAVVVGAIVMAPPLIWAGYSFAYDQELDPYVGGELRQRVLILSAIFAALWLIYAYVPLYVLELTKPSEMSIVVAAVMFAIVLTMATFAAVGVFELDTVGGLTVAGVYFVSTLFLAYAADVKLFGQEPPPRRGTVVPPEPTAWRRPVEPRLVDRVSLPIVADGPGALR
jgi:hypothetical protein